MRVVIIDGYTDEPAGLGVPPYLDVYPRYVAGAVLTKSRGAELRYFTVNEFRRNFDLAVKTAGRADLVVFIAGVVVPGKYLGGEPMTLRELTLWPSLLDRPVKVLGGPAARFGFGVEGGKPAYPPKFFENYFDLVVRGDLEEAVAELLDERLSVERVDPYATRRDYRAVAEYAVRGAVVAAQHPNFERNLVAEIETFRGCPRWVVGGCSFCVEPGYGRVMFREEEDIHREVEALYRVGVRCFRLGRQPDILAYKAFGVNEVEFPRPNVEALERLFRGVRLAAPEAETIHIDNVNPGTVYHHREEAEKALKVIVRYHTSGDVAAMGIESADPEVVRANNLKVYPEEAYEAIRLVNKVGAARGKSGLPHLLPGINFVLGLAGETKKTFTHNLEFLRRLLRDNLLVRRINIRQVLPLPGTRMWLYGSALAEKHKALIARFKARIRREIDLPMMRKVVPRGTVLRGVYVEDYEGNYSLARQPASYPILVYIPMRLPLYEKLDVLVVDHGPRSVTGIPFPLNVNKASASALAMVPGLGRAAVTRILAHRPFRSMDRLREVVGDTGILKYLTIED